FDHLRASATGPPTFPLYVCWGDSPVMREKEKSHPTRPLKLSSCVRVVHEPSYPAHMRGGYEGARACPGSPGWIWPTTNHFFSLFILSFLTRPRKYRASN
uniref:Uncharacterized protein n=1 Tax=Aegilops tauschii subsp. strangulata TaxID=200361 RepID=A0A453NSS7_AEGTS